MSTTTTSTSQFSTWTPVAWRPRTCMKDGSLFWSDLAEAPITADEAWAAHIRGELLLANRHLADAVVLVCKSSNAWKQSA